MATQEQYYAEFEGRSDVPGNLGNHRFISLEDLINNYMVMYGDETSHGGTAMRRKVEAFAQRAIQEYSYDTFQAKTWEYEVIDRATFPMPQDFVELVGINYVDQYGLERWITPRVNSSDPRSPLQFNNTPNWMAGLPYPEGAYVRVDVSAADERATYVVFRASADIPMDDPQPTVAIPGNWVMVDSGETGYVYDSNGKIILLENTSYTKTKWDENDDYRNPEILTGTQAGNYAFRGYGEYGNKYYANPETLNQNPTYYLNEESGVIDLDTILIGEVINITYISDGLSSDLSEVKVHKFTEQAVYEFIYYEMISHMSRVPANEKERARRRKIAMQKQAKLRLMKLSPRDMIQIFRQQAKWIKT